MKLYFSITISTLLFKYVSTMQRGDEGSSSEYDDDERRGRHRRHPPLGCCSESAAPGGTWPSATITLPPIDLRSLGICEALKKLKVCSSTCQNERKERCRCKESPSPLYQQKPCLPRLSLCATAQNCGPSLCLPPEPIYPPVQNCPPLSLCPPVSLCKPAPVSLCRPRRPRLEVTCQSTCYLPNFPPCPPCPSPVTRRECYIQTMMQYFSATDRETADLAERQYFILSLIFDNLGSDLNSLILFTANAVFNTSNFKYLVGGDKCDRYRSRGLLQITGLENYEILNTLDTGLDPVNWVTHPYKLGRASEEAIRITCLFWIRIVYCPSDRTYESTLAILNPEEINCYSLCVTDPALRRRNRRMIYEELRCLLSRC